MQWERMFEVITILLTILSILQNVQTSTIPNNNEQNQETPVCCSLQQEVNNLARIANSEEKKKELTKENSSEEVVMDPLKGTFIPRENSQDYQNEQEITSSPEILPESPQSQNTEESIEATLQILNEIKKQARLEEMKKIIEKSLEEGDMHPEKITPEKRKQLLDSLPPEVVAQMKQDSSPLLTENEFIMPSLQTSMNKFIYSS